MGFSGAGDGQTTQNAQEPETVERVLHQEGGSTAAKIGAVIFMVLLIGGVVVYGYFSMAAREELHRRERRAREWKDYDEDDE